jgi:histidine triad (HIT) family protein
MDDCIFCKIVKNEIPSFKIYEDGDFLAFLDIFPATEGFTLVIPKRHYRWVWDVPESGKYFEVCQKIARHFQKVTQSESVYSMILGEEVPHAHIKIFPGDSNKIKEAIHHFSQETRTSSPLASEEGEKIAQKFKL